MFASHLHISAYLPCSNRYLKSKKSTIKVVLADPTGSSLFNKVVHGVCYTPQQSEKTGNHSCPSASVVFTDSLDPTLTLSPFTLTYRYPSDPDTNPRNPDLLS